VKAFIICVRTFITVTLKKSEGTFGDLKLHRNSKPKHLLINGFVYLLLLRLKKGLFKVK